MCKTYKKLDEITDRTFEDGFESIKESVNKSTDRIDETIQKRFENYQPKSVRRVEIPKNGGGLRPLGIPCMHDRIIQQCIKNQRQERRLCIFPTSNGIWSIRQIKRENRQTQHHHK